MDKDSIIKALIDWNFWYKEQFLGIRRDEYVDALLQRLNTGLVVNISGVKRAGKSTIINQAVKKLIEKGIDPFDTLIINFEDPRINVSNANELFAIYELYKEIRKSKGKPYLFLDEIQKVKDWEGFVRSLSDRKEANIVVTGSTSELSDLDERLAGRHISLDVFPLSFKEFLRFKGVEIPENEIDLIANEDKIKRLFQEYLKFGGFPIAVLSDMKENVLITLYDDIITKDVIQNCKIRNEKELKDLSLFYLSNSSNRVTFRRLSRLLNIPIKNVLRYSSCLMNAFLVFFVNPLNPKLSEMIKGEKKVYCIDNGLINVIGYRLNENIGSLFENMIFLELLRRYGNKIYYYRGNKGEVDFVIKDYNEAYQVTYTFSNEEREVKGLKELLERKSDIKAKIITFDEEGEIEIKGKKVPIIKAWRWLIENK